MASRRARGGWNIFTRAHRLSYTYLVEEAAVEFAAAARTLFWDGIATR